MTENKDMAAESAARKFLVEACERNRCMMERDGPCAKSAIEAMVAYGEALSPPSSPRDEGLREIVAHALWADGQMRLGCAQAPLPDSRSDFRALADERLKHPTFAALSPPIVDVVPGMREALQEARATLDAFRFGRRVDLTGAIERIDVALTNSVNDGREA